MSGADGHGTVLLLACSRCHRQYDVGQLQVGERVRCACGHLNQVAAPRPRRVAMLHCSNCGGRLRDGSPRCDYCSAEVLLADRGLGPACPECFTGTFVGAKHCAGCGVRLAPEAVLRALADRPCPRCRQPLTEREDEGRRHVECTRCGGLWLDEALFERIASEKERALPAAIRGPSPRAAAQPSGREDVRYVPCPVCGQIMNRRNFAGCSGTVLDWCRGHGWWFDAAELERVLAFLEQGGMERARRVQHEQQLSELRRERERSERIPVFPVERRTRRPSLVEALAEVLFEILT